MKSHEIWSSGHSINRLKQRVGCYSNGLYRLMMITNKVWRSFLPNIWRLFFRLIFFFFNYQSHSPFNERTIWLRVGVKDIRKWIKRIMFNACLVTDKESEKRRTPHCHWNRNSLLRIWIVWSFTSIWEHIARNVVLGYVNQWKWGFSNLMRGRLNLQKTHKWGFSLVQILWDL